jgi:hypothetical protein
LYRTVRVTCRFFKQLDDVFPAGQSVCQRARQGRSKPVPQRIRFEVFEKK